jgi:hypothetical protein
VSTDEQHVALPKLYGAPAYARPRRSVPDAPRPFDPDDLPIAAYQTDEERALAGSESNGHDGTSASQPQLQPRPFRLRALATRLLERN